MDMARIVRTVPSLVLSSLFCFWALSPATAQKPSDGETPEQEVEQLLQEMGNEPSSQSLKNQKSDQSIENQIDSLLKESESRESQPPPELGVGLGARLSAFNPNISLIGDFFGVTSSAPDNFDGAIPRIPLSFYDAQNVDRIGYRSVELMATAAVDPYADALIKLPFSEDGVEIEEAYVLFHDYPFRDNLPTFLQDVQTKVGIFRMAAGPMNLVDDHDVPTVDEPLALQRFLGSEGLKRAGISLSKVIPRQPWVSEWTVEFTNGEPPGNEPGAPPFAGINHPLGLIHHKLFREIEPETTWNVDQMEGCDPTWADGRQTLEFGATFAATGSRVPGTGENLFSLMQGFDVTWQWFDPRPDTYRQFLLQSELYVSELDQPADGVRGDVGTYLVAQTRLDREHFLGVRWDITEFPDRDGYEFAVTPFLTYFLTEFNRVRFQYQYLRQETDSERDLNGHTFWIQLVFALGAHPPEPYYMGQRF